MSDYWEDRLAKIPGAHRKVERAFTLFRRSSMDHHAQSELYDKLTSLGITAEEADEMINLELTD